MGVEDQLVHWVVFNCVLFRYEFFVVMVCKDTKFFIWN